VDFNFPPQTERQVYEELGGIFATCYTKESNLY